LPIESWVWNSLISSRIIRSTEPNRNSLTAFASSVLPVPVGPANKKTPIGLLGSLRPAFSMAMRPTIASTASSCPMTRAAKKLRTALRSSCSLVSRIETGRPESCDSVCKMWRGPIDPSASVARSAVSLSMSSAEPGRPLPERYWPAASRATWALSGAKCRPVVLAMLASTSSASANVSLAGKGSMVMVSKTPRSDGLICISRARPLGVVSPKTTRRPAAIAGTIWSSMVALWP
jgi:hypothetical protein